MFFWIYLIYDTNPWYPGLYFMTRVKFGTLLGTPEYRSLEDRGRRLPPWRHCQSDSHLLDFRDENLSQLAGWATVTTQRHILVGGAAMRSILQAWLWWRCPCPRARSLWGIEWRICRRSLKFSLFSFFLSLVFSISDLKFKYYDLESKYSRNFGSIYPLVI